MVIRCTGLQFWAPWASQAPPLHSFIVDEFNRVDEGGCSTASRKFLYHFVFICLCSCVQVPKQVIYCLCLNFSLLLRTFLKCQQNLFQKYQQRNLVCVLIPKPKPKLQYVLRSPTAFSMPFSWQTFPLNPVILTVIIS